MGFERIMAEYNEELSGSRPNSLPYNSLTHNYFFFVIRNFSFILFYFFYYFKVPLGLVDDPSSPYQGLPVGVQVVAARGQDRLALAVAAEAERLLGGWVPPNGVV